MIQLIVVYHTLGMLQGYVMSTLTDGFCKMGWAWLGFLDFRVPPGSKRHKRFLCVKRREWKKCTFGVHRTGSHVAVLV